MGPRGRGGASRHVTRFSRAAGLMGEGRVGKGRGQLGAKRDWTSGLVGRGRGRGRPRERARLANFQCGTALAAVRARAAARTSARLSPMVGAHVGRMPRDRASPEKKACFPFFSRFFPLPHVGLSVSIIEFISFRRLDKTTFSLLVL